MSLKYNPFRPNSIVNAGMFCGRGSEIKALEQALYQTKHENPQHFLLEGERGIGKSSLCLLIEKYARGAIPISGGLCLNFIVVSIELKSSSDYFEIIQKIASDLKREIETREKIKTHLKSGWDFISKWEILGVKYNKDASNQEHYRLLDDLATALENITNELGDNIDGILILIDEADKPPAEANLGEIVKLLTERLTKKGCEKVCIGLSGLPTLVPKLRASHESAPRLFTIQILEPLTTEERLEVIDRGLKDARERNGIRIQATSEAKNWISTLSEGYPHFIQQFAYCAFDEANNEILDQGDVLRGAFKENGALQQLGSKFFNEMYFDKINSDEYREVLQYMSSKMDAWVTRADVISGTDLKQTTIDNAFKALKTRNIILVSETKKGHYRLPSKSFAVWIKALITKKEKA